MRLILAVECGDPYSLRHSASKQRHDPDQRGDGRRQGVGPQQRPRHVGAVHHDVRDEDRDDEELNQRLEFCEGDILVERPSHAQGCPAHEGPRRHRHRSEGEATQPGQPIDNCEEEAGDPAQAPDLAEPDHFFDRDERYKDEQEQERPPLAKQECDQHDRHGVSWRSSPALVANATQSTTLPRKASTAEVAARLPTPRRSPNERSASLTG